MTSAVICVFLWIWENVDDLCGDDDDDDDSVQTAVCNSHVIMMVIMMIIGIVEMIFVQCGVMISNSWKPNEIELESHSREQAQWIAIYGMMFWRHNHTKSPLFVNMTVHNGNLCDCDNDDDDENEINTSILWYINPNTIAMCSIDSPYTIIW